MHCTPMIVNYLVSEGNLGRIELLDVLCFLGTFTRLGLWYLYFYQQGLAAFGRVYVYVSFSNRISAYACAWVSL